MKKPTIYSILLLLISGSVSCFSQNNNNRYQLGSYQIDSENRIVYGEEMVGGTGIAEDGSVYHWDGVRSVPVPYINYDMTSLILFGNFLTFKEDFHSKCNIYQAKILRLKISREWNLVVKEKKKLYTFSNKKEDSVIDISKYTHITDCVFQDKAGKIYFLYDESHDELTELTQIEHLDLKSLQHIVENYYMDKNGLYFFGRDTSSTIGHTTTRWNDSGMLKKSDGKNIMPIVSNGYFIYDDAVYSTKDKNKVIKLSLDDKKLNEIHLAGTSYVFKDDKDYYITDGDDIYRYWRTSWSWEKTNLDDIFQSGKIDNQPEKWKHLGSILVKDHKQSSEKKYYYPSVDIPSGSGFYNDLYYSADGFYTSYKPSSLHKPVVTKKDSVFIRNYDTKQYELLDVSQYRLLSSNKYLSTH